MTGWAQLGRAGNVLRGLRARWDAEGGPLVSPPQDPFITFEAAPPAGSEAHWTMPTVSLHDDVASLAGAAFGLRLASVDPGAIMAGPDVLAYLGLGPGAGRSFVLVRVARIGEPCVHEVLARPPRRAFVREDQLTAECRRAESRLRPGPRPHAPRGKRLDAAAAQAYLDHFEAFGTHFISSVGFGDVVLQAFAFDGDEWRSLLAASGFAASERVLTGERALACSALLGAARSRDAGRIISVAGDPAAVEAVAGEASLLAPFAREGDRALERLTEANAQAPVDVELAPLSRFLELYRALNWERLLAGALAQRFGEASDIVLPGGAPHADELADALLRPPPGQGSGYAERLGGSDLTGAAVVVGLSLELREGAVVDVGAELLAVHALLSPTRTIATAPRLVLDDAAFETFALIVEHMDGAVLVTNRSGTARATLTAGLLLTDAGVRCAAHVVRADEVERIAPLLPLVLRSAERLLCLGRPEAWRAAEALLAWVERLPAPEPVLARARALARIGPAFSLRGGNAGRDVYLAGVLDAARTGDTALARHVHDAFWWDGAAAPDSGDALAELHLLRAHALTISGRSRATERARL